MPKILIIDDHQLTVDVIVDILSEEGIYDIYSFTQLPGLQFIQAIGPDVIILDACLQKTNSLHICRELKDLLEKIKVIIISAYIDSSTLAYQFGADAFIKKPFDIDDLLETVDTCSKKQTTAD